MKQFIESLKTNNTVTELKHAYRINGVVDLWKNNKTVYDKTVNQYYEIESEEERFALVAEMVKIYPKQPAFKKTKKGGMTMQEFRNNVYQAFKK